MSGWARTGRRGGLASGGGGVRVGCGLLSSRSCLEAVLAGGRDTTADRLGI